MKKNKRDCHREYSPKQPKLSWQPGGQFPSSADAATTLLTKIIQGPQESYAQFMGRLQEAAERILGLDEVEGTLVKQLDFKNANAASACT